MTMNPNQAQDVWKDAGEHVQFTVLELKREDQAKEQAAIEEFVDRYQAIIRSLRIRDNKGNLKASLGFSNAAWDYLFPNAPKPKELETYETISGDKYSMPATKGDIFLHIQHRHQIIVLKDKTDISSAKYRPFTALHLIQPLSSHQNFPFRYFEGRAIIGFIDGTEAPQVEDAADYAIVGDEDPFFENGSYAFAQKWRHHMDIWNKLTTEDQEKAVGRKKFSDLELKDQEKFKNAHNVASQAKINGVEQKIVRMNVPTRLLGSPGPTSSATPATGRSPRRCWRTWSKSTTTCSPSPTS